MKKCLICQSSLSPFMSFGKQPLANGFLTKEQFKSEYFFELKVCFCENCYMVQLEEQPAPESMFNENYAFFSGTSRLMADHFRHFAQDIQTRYLKETKDPFVVEIGSNDGILLRNFRDARIRHLGIEPSANVAAVAIGHGIPTLNKFFNSRLAEDVSLQHGQADAILAANVMCHIASFHSVIDGMRILLKSDGVIAFEDPYIGDVLEKVAYDQFYDEHVFLFSAHSIQHAFRQHGLELVDVQPQTVHGGSMRYVLAHKGAREVSPAVAELLEKERQKGITQIKTYHAFREQCEASRDALVGLLTTVKKEKKRVVGYAATSKSTTILNYCQIGPELVDFISDTTPIKQGKFSPGMHVPVIAYEHFRENYPDYAILFGWNHKTEILAKEQEFLSSGGRWITFVPKVEILK